MPAFVVQDLVNRAAALADIHDNFVRPEQWLSWYNVERQALQLFMARHGSAMQDLAFQTVVAPDSVTISGDILAVVGVWEVRPNSTFRPINISDFPGNFFQNVGGPVTGPTQVITLEDTNTATTSSVVLRFFPRDPAGTYIIVTAKSPPVALSTTSTVSLPMGIEEWIVVRLARRALIKEESDTGAVDRLVAEQNSLVEEFVSSRSLAQGAAVRNVDAKVRGEWTSELLYPEVTRWRWV